MLGLERWRSKKRKNFGDLHKKLGICTPPLYGMLRAVQASSPALWDRSVHLVEIHLPIEGEAWVIRQEGDSATSDLRGLAGGAWGGSGVSQESKTIAFVTTSTRILLFTPLTYL